MILEKTYSYIIYFNLKKKITIFCLALSFCRTTGKKLQVSCPFISKYFSRNLVFLEIVQIYNENNAIFILLRCWDKFCSIDFLFKGLDLIDRVPDELWNEVRDTVQETGIKTILMEKKWKKVKCLSEKALQIAVKRREAKSKGEKERYKHLNAEFQRRARRDKKAFFSNQCKEIEENKRMGKTRDLFKKIRDTKEHFVQRWAR